MDLWSLGMVLQLSEHTLLPRLRFIVCDLSEAPCAARLSRLTFISDAVDSLSKEVTPLGLKTLLIEPGTFMTDLLSLQNSKSVKQQIEDYGELSENIGKAFAELNGKQLGDPKKGVNIIIGVVKGETGAAVKTWPSSLPLGSDSVEVIRKKCENTLREIHEWETLSRSTDF